MTNGDRIRSMTDEELADILPTGDCFCCPIMTTKVTWAPHAGKMPVYDSCEECALAWLKRQVDLDIH